MGIRDWDIVTSYVDSVTTTLKTVTFPKVQEQVKVKNQGNANLTYAIGSQSGTLTPGQSITVNEDISSFTIQAASGTQAFELRAKEKGTEQTEDISSDAISILSENAKKQIAKSNVYPDKTADYTVQTSIWETSLITNPTTFYAKVQSAGGALNNYFRYNIRMQESGPTYPLYQGVSGVTSTTSQTSDFTVEFMTDATQMEILFRATTNWVHVIADNEIVAKLTLSTDRTLITFPTKKPRHIKLLCQSNSRFAGITVDARSNVWRCHEARKKIIIDGDSIAWGANNLGQALNSPVGIISQMFDWDFYNNAMGGTGYVADSSGTSVPIIQRIKGIIDEKPDVILILNGLNDCSATYLLTLESKVNEYFTALKANFPTKDIIITSPFNPKSDLTSVAYIQEVEAVIRARALAYKLPYIDLLRGNTYDKNGNLITSSQGGIITGTGSVANVQPTGNASIYMSSDTTHTSPEGGRYLGFRIAEEVYKILKS
jgi:lysophospholipase L1-like esterase